MADFAKWVTAAEPVLPWKPGAFMEAYSGNRTDAVSLALDSDVVASVVRQFMEDRGKWEGTPTDLLAALRDLAPEDVRKLKTWPKAANGLTKRLRRMATFLRATGIELDLDGKTPDSSRTRIVTVTKYVQKTVRTVQTVREDQQNLTDQDFSTQTLRTVADDTRTVSDDNADDTQIQPSDHNPALDTDSDDSDDSDGKKHTLCNDTINPDIVEYF
jgi:acyl transferase domain-containing protein